MQRLLALGIVLVLFGVSTMSAAEATWKVGTARAKITPQEPLWLAGYASRTHAADGKLHDLWAKVLVLEAADGTRAVLVTSDLLGFPKSISEAIYARVHERDGLERRQLALTSSHTHSGPVLDTCLRDCYPLDDTQLERIGRYADWLAGTVADAIHTALADLQPATLWAGQGNTPFAVNRRNNNEAQVPKLREEGIALKGPNDHDLPVLVVRNPDGSPRAIVFGYACHSTTLDGYQWCGDYSGYTQLALEAKYPGVQAMFWIGCGADQNPLPRRTIPLCEQYGQTLAAAVDAVLAGELRSLAPSLRTAFAYAEIGLEGISTREALKDEIAKAPGAVNAAIATRRAARIGKLLDDGVTLPTSYPIPVEVWKLGDSQLWILLGGEVVVDYALQFKERYGRQTWVSGYTNDVMAYIPSERVWKEGRYEANAFAVYGIAADHWAPDIQVKLTNTVEQLIQSLQ